MKSARFFLGILLSGLALTAGGLSSTARSAIYEAPLPVELSTDPDMCAYAPCRDVLAGVDSFSNRKGRPSYVEAYKTVDGKKKLVGYVFLSTDIVDIPAYSGKPIVTLIGMDTKGIITGIKILRHSEPILLVGIPESELTKFTRQYVGKFAGDKIEVGKARDGYIGVDAISGATVTVITENRVILRCAYEVAKEVGIIKPPQRPPVEFASIAKMLDWPTLVKEGSIRRLTVTPADMGIKGTGEPYIDLYFGYLNVPTIGQSVLGVDAYRRLMDQLKPGESAIFIIGSGTASFKGSGFVRGGIFDRIQIAQEMETFTFRDTDYFNLYGIHAAGAPAYRESGIFFIRSKHFSPAYPWSLTFLGHKVNEQTGEKIFVNFDKEYWLPGRYLIGGRPRYERPAPTWVRIWQGKTYEIAAFAVLLLAAGLVFGLRDKLVRRADHKTKRWVLLPRYFFWITSLGFVGYFAMAQPSITHVLTWFHSLLYRWKWELFLSDPVIFVFWWFIIISVFIWGRGLFCGWLCPYGALQELAFRAVGAVGLKRVQFVLPKSLHDKLKWTKYLVFAGLLGVSFYSMSMAEKLAEVEPFKSTFLVGVWNRSWPFILYWVVLFAAALVVDRPFCKYLCPLGAGLAIPSTFRFFGLKRKSECTTCKACAKGCTSLAIDAKGNIDQRECLLCLDCMILYYDARACPPLSQERKRRAKAGLPLTPINSGGYFVPLEEVRGDLERFKKRKVVNI